MAKGIKDWERNKAEVYAEKYWTEHEFDFEVKRKYMSKTIYTIRKDGLEFPYTITSDVMDVEAYMGFFAEQFELRKQIAELQKKGE